MLPGFTAIVTVLAAEADTEPLEGETVSHDDPPEKNFVVTWNPMVPLPVLRTAT